MCYHRRVPALPTDPRSAGQRQVRSRCMHPLRRPRLRGPDRDNPTPFEH